MFAEKTLTEACNEKMPLRNGFLIITFVIIFVCTGITALNSLLLSNQPLKMTQKELWLKSMLNRVSENPGDTEALIGLGYFNYTAGNYEEAMSWYSEAYKSRPDSPQVLYHLALGYLGTEQLDKAIEILTPMAEKGLFNFDVHFALGNAYYRSGQYAEAIHSLEKAAFIRPVAADALYLLGLSHEGLGENEQAVKHYDKALKMVPDYEDVIIALNRLTLGAGQPDDNN